MQPYKTWLSETKQAHPFLTICVLTSAAISTTAFLFGVYLEHRPPPTVNPKDIPPHRWRKHVVTSDGRTVEYCVYGSTKSDANVLIEIAGGLGLASFYPQYPGLDDLYKALNVKGIAVTLPGWGYSSLHPGRKYVDFPKTDIDPILSAENVDGAFAVSGASLGAPHAMAVAHHFGADRVSALGLNFVSILFLILMFDF